MKVAIVDPTVAPHVGGHVVVTMLTGERLILRLFSHAEERVVGTDLNGDPVSIDMSGMRGISHADLIDARPAKQEAA